MSARAAAVPGSGPGGGLGVRRLLPAIGAGVVAVACGIGLLATSGWLITRASQRPPVFELSIAIGTVQAFALGRGVARYLQRLTLHGAALDVVGRLRLALFDAVEPLVPGGLGPGPTARVLTGLVADADLVAEGFAKRVGAAIDVSASIAIGGVLAVVVDPAAAAVLGAGAACVVALALASARLARASAVSEASTRAELGAMVVDTVRSAPELVALGRLDVVDDALGAVRRRSMAAARRRAVAAGLGRATVVGASGAAVMAVAAVGVATHDAGHLSGVMLAVLTFTALATFDQLSSLPAVTADLAGARSAAASLERLVRHPPPVPDPPGGIEALAPVGPAGPGAVLDGATVGHGADALLRGVSLAVGTGGRAAVMGASGAGKTTALHAMVRFVRCSAGRAGLGGDDVAGLSRRTIAERAGWMADETHVFAATVADNLRLARPDADDDACAAVLALVGLGPWMASLPLGLATVLGAGGQPVSAGERQRLGLARALLARQQVLLLDEPTAHLDADSGPGVLDDLLAAAGDRPVVVVTHDPAVTARVDEVVVLDGGRVVQRHPGGRQRATAG